MMWNSKKTNPSGGKPEESPPPADTAGQPAADAQDQALPEEAPEVGEQAVVAAVSAEQEWKDKYLRAKADLANFQKRAEKERLEGLRYANAGLIKALLPVIDDIERVVQSSPEAESASNPLLSGVRMTLENFRKVLSQFHVECIDAAEQPFDPMVHEALMEQSSPAHPPRTVLSVVARGYRLHDRVLRPAKVIVSRADESAVCESPATGSGASQDTGGCCGAVP